MLERAPALIGLLGIASAVLVVVFGVLGYLARPMPEGADWSIGRTLWMARPRGQAGGPAQGPFAGGRGGAHRPAGLGSLGKLRIVCRTGSPTEPADLELVSPQSAAAVLVLTPEVDDPDASVIKTLLALSTRKWDGEPPHVVAAIRQAQNLPPARLAGGRHASVVDVDDLGARLVVQSSRQSGLSVVCTDLLDFGGDEIYLRPEPTLTGAPFWLALFAYETATVIGLRRRGRVRLNPRPDTRIEQGDELILIAEDDSMIRLAPTPLRPGAPQTIARPRRRAVRRGSLETLGIGDFDHVIVLADDTVEPEKADSRTLVTLLHLRDMESRRNERYSIVSEMNDERNQRLAQVTKAGNSTSRPSSRRPGYAARQRSATASWRTHRRHRRSACG